MRLSSGSAALTFGPAVAEPPAVAVLEVGGAVLAWTIDDPEGAVNVRMTITDVVAADWLWRVVGPTGHAAIVAGAGTADYDVQPGVLEPLHRLAVGHWLRRWWPESLRDGFARLDPALLDGELAILTETAQEFFTQDTFDSDLEGLLGPHRVPLLALERTGDPRVVDLVRSCADLATESGAWPMPEGPVPPVDSPRGRRGDYALAAGTSVDREPAAIASGTGSVEWVLVPPGILDAAEDTIDWSIGSADGSVVATVRVALTGMRSARGIGVRLRSGTVNGTGVLDAGGTGAFTMVGRDDRPLTESQAWDHDWSRTSVAIGVAGTGEGRTVRNRLRSFARTRLMRPGPDAFLAEIVAAESDY